MTGSKFVLSDYHEEKGPLVTFGGNGKGQTRGYGTLTNGVTTFKRVAYVEGLMHNLLTSTDMNWLWHKRLSHLNFKTMNQLSINKLVTGLPDHLFTKVFFLRSKSVAPEEIIFFVKKMEKLNNLLLILIPQVTPQQNGVVERRNKTLIGAARSMSSEANLATQFWVEAINTACYTQNRSLIVKCFKKIVYQLLRNRKPSIKHFHIFGCNWYILNNKDNLGKFDSKSDDGIFLGYSSISKAYLVFNKP
ncbi:hypothetical protein OSB04_019656 [Centaurea solstitialis]|uniref:Integrase catalytic domain-containing protein n=1 Tax=Centaurea solstitialis TaxID=347529 RepID=A0AA38SYE4_9ASTR|nr:hypothetical protein OSB04_019656 [Centaurea solstitialis]